jgi:hypothetical protein
MPYTLMRRLLRPASDPAAHYRRVSIGLLLVSLITVLYRLFGSISVAATHSSISPNQDFSNPTLQQQLLVRPKMQRASYCVLRRIHELDA